MPAVIPLIIGLATAATTASGIYNSTQGGNGQPTPAQIAEQAKQSVSGEEKNRQLATKQAAQFLPQLQSDTSGGLSPDALKQFSATFSGNANLANSPEMSQMVAKFLGLDTGATFGGSEPFGSSSGGSSPLSPGLTGG